MAKLTEEQKKAESKAKAEAKDKAEAKAKAKAKAKAEAKAKAKAETAEMPAIDCSGVTCGIGQAQEHHRRLTILERQMARLLEDARAKAE